MYVRAEVMAMDTHSKNVCLIGILHVVFYLFVSINPLSIVCPHIFHYSSGQYLVVGGYFILMAVFAALMVRGAIKKQHKLLAPFLVMSLTYLLYESLKLLNRLVLNFGLPLYRHEEHFYRIVITIISSYTIYTLYIKLRLQYMKEKSLSDLSEDGKKKSVKALEQQLII